MVARYIEQFLSRMEGMIFRRMIKRKVRLMMEIKDIQEKLELSEKQLKAIELL